MQWTASLLLSISVLCLLVFIDSGIPCCWIYLPTLVLLPAPSCLPYFSVVSFLPAFPWGICEALLVNRMFGHGLSSLCFLWMSFVCMSVRCQELLYWSLIRNAISFLDECVLACLYVPKDKSVLYTDLSIVDSDNSPNWLTQTTLPTIILIESFWEEGGRCGTRHAL